jgi:hypothetical protein
MVSTIQELSGLNKSLDRLNQRIVAYRKLLGEIAHGGSPDLALNKTHGATPAHDRVWKAPQACSEMGLAAPRP